ncbi:hypothetical protein F973_02746, partial [Acinetobacter sp. CIP 102129]
MNSFKSVLLITCKFLNGVCRHEHFGLRFEEVLAFLNGVCRHELNVPYFIYYYSFLNGVCRHE